LNRLDQGREVQAANVIPHDPRFVVLGQQLIERTLLELDLLPLGVPQPLEADPRRQRPLGRPSPIFWGSPKQETSIHHASSRFHTHKPGPYGRLNASRDK
jgi:hypothetical protein